MGAALLCEGSYNDLSSLQNHVCLYKGKAVFVRRTDQQHRVQISYVEDPFVTVTVDHREKEFRYNSPPLGYMNIENEALYLRRIAGCGRSAAIHEDSILISPSSLVETLYSLKDSPDRRWILRKEFAQCVEGVHPSFYEAFERIQSGAANGVAFHRTLAFRVSDRGRVILEKRGVETAAILKDKNIIVMDTATQSTLIRHLPKDLTEKGFNVTTL